MRIGRVAVLLALATPVATAGIPAHASGRPSAKLTVSGGADRGGMVTLTRTTVVDGASFSGTGSGPLVGMAVEAESNHQVRLVVARFRGSTQVLGATGDPLTLAAGRYRLHLIGAGARSASLTVMSGTGASTVATVRSPVRVNRETLGTGPAAIGAYRAQLTLGPGRAALLAYRLVAEAMPAAAVHVAFSDVSNGNADPNSAFPVVGGPLLLTSTFLDGVEASVTATLFRTSTAPPGTYRADVVAGAATLPTSTEVLLITV